MYLDRDKIDEYKKCEQIFLEVKEALISLGIVSYTIFFDLESELFLSIGMFVRFLIHSNLDFIHL